MRTFRDSQGRVWSVAINVASVKRVRNLLGEDLLAIEAILPRLLIDPILLCDVLYCLCQPEAEARNVSDEDFAAAMAGTTIAAAKEALIAEYIDFFPDANHQQTIRAAITKHRELYDRVTELTVAKIGTLELPPEIMAALSDVGNASTN